MYEDSFFVRNKPFIVILCLFGIALLAILIGWYLTQQPPKPLEPGYYIVRS